MMRPPSKLPPWLAPCAIVMVACGLRFWQLGDVPYGVFPDEGVNGEDALRALRSSQYLWFYPDNHGREGLFINLTAFTTAVFGRNPFALRFTAAVFGVLLVAAVYLLGREAFRSRGTGLIAAALTATSFWAINFSRIAFRGILLPTVLAFSFAFLLRGIRTRNPVSTAVAGALLGLSLHTYAAARLAPFILVPLVLAWSLTEPQFLRRHGRSLTLYAVLAVAVALPMLLEFASNRAALMGRAEQVSVFSPEVNGGDPLGTLVRSIGSSLGKYFVIGDASWRHNHPPYPILHPVVSMALLIGLLWTTGRTFSALWRRLRSADPRDPGLPVRVLLLSWFGIMLAAEFLTAEGLPHALRSIGTMPPVFLMAALPFAWLWERAARAGRPTVRRALVGSVLGLLLFTGVFNTVKYFGFWARDPRQAIEFHAPWRKIAADLETLPDPVHKYVMLNAGGFVRKGGAPLTRGLFRYLVSDRVKNLRLVHAPTAFHAPFFAAMLIRHEEAVRDFRAGCPGGELRFTPVEGFPDIGYWAFHFQRPGAKR